MACGWEKPISYFKTHIITRTFQKRCTKKKKMFVHTYNMLCFAKLHIAHFVFVCYLSICQQGDATRESHHWNFKKCEGLK